MYRPQRLLNHNGNKRWRNLYIYIYIYIYRNEYIYIYIYMYRDCARVWPPPLLRDIEHRPHVIYPLLVRPNIGS